MRIFKLLIAVFILCNVNASWAALCQTDMANAGLLKDETYESACQKSCNSNRTKEKQVCERACIEGAVNGVKKIYNTVADKEESCKK